MHWLVKGILGLVGLAICLMLVFVALNWRDEAPSDLARQLNQPAPALSDDRNLYLPMLGFNAPSGQDPKMEGVRQVKAFQTYYAQRPLSPGILEQGNLVDEPAPRNDAQKALAMELTPLPGALRLSRKAITLCDPSIDCLNQTSPPEQIQQWQQLLKQHAELVTRYGQLQQSSDLGFVSPMPVDVLEPFIPYDSILATHQLLLGLAVQDAQRGHFVTMLDFLAKDTAFWRQILAGHNSLVDDMAALNRLRLDMAWVSVLLADPRFDTNRYRAMLAQILRPLTPQERDISPALKREFQLHVAVYLDYQRTTKIKSRPFEQLIFKPQAAINRTAATDKLFQEIAAAPVNSFVRLSSELPQKRASIQSGDCVFRQYCLNDFIGHTLTNMNGPDLTENIGRVFDMDAYIRLVGLQHQLRQQNIATQSVPDVIDRDPVLLNPYTNQPFSWNPQTAQLSFKPHGKWPSTIDEAAWAVTVQP